MSRRKLKSFYGSQGNNFGRGKISSLTIIELILSKIDQLTQPFNAKDYKDEFSEKLLKVIESKAKGKGATVRQMKSTASITTIDLMESLKASLKTSSRKKAS